MPRYVPNPRNEDEIAALRTCLDAILAVHGDAAGYTYVWQRKDDLSNLWFCRRMPEFADKFLDQPWVFENDYPAELYFRQQTYYVPWWRASSVKCPPVAELRCVAIDLDPYNLDPPLPLREAVDGALTAIKEAGLPPPNHVDYSGDGTNGGAYLRWLIDLLAGDTALSRYRDRILWQDTVSTLLDILAPFGADRCPADLACWLRVPGSINAKYLGVGNGGPSFRDVLHTGRIPLDELAGLLGVERLPEIDQPVRRPPVDPVRGAMGAR